MKKIIFILFMSVFLISCKKERTFHITAKNAVTGEPYPGLEYQVIRSWSGPFENKYKIVGSGTLNENGEVYFTKRLQKNSSYSITVQEPPNTCYNKNINLSPKGETNFTAEFEFAECAYMKQDIKNVNCEGATDTFSIRDKYSYTNWTGWIDLSGCFSNIGGEYSKVPEGERIFQWEVTRPSGNTTGIDTIVFSAGSYETLTIHY